MPPPESNNHITDKPLVDKPTDEPIPYGPTYKYRQLMHISQRLNDQRNKNNPTNTTVQEDTLSQHKKTQASSIEYTPTNQEPKSLKRGPSTWPKHEDTPTKPPVEKPSYYTPNLSDFIQTHPKDHSYTQDQIPPLTQPNPSTRPTTLEHKSPNTPDIQKHSSEEFAHRPKMPINDKPQKISFMQYNPDQEKHKRYTRIPTEPQPQPKDLITGPSTEVTGPTGYGPKNSFITFKLEQKVTTSPITYEEKMKVIGDLLAQGLPRNKKKFQDQRRMICDEILKIELDEFNIISDKIDSSIPKAPRKKKKRPEDKPTDEPGHQAIEKILVFDQPASQPFKPELPKYFEVAGTTVTPRQPQTDIGSNTFGILNLAQKSDFTPPPRVPTWPMNPRENFYASPGRPDHTHTDHTQQPTYFPERPAPAPRVPTWPMHQTLPATPVNPEYLTCTVFHTTDTTVKSEPTITPRETPNKTEVQYPQPNQSTLDNKKIPRFNERSTEERKKIITAITSFQENTTNLSRKEKKEPLKKLLEELKKEELEITINTYNHVVQKIRTGNNK